MTPIRRRKAGDTGEEEQEQKDVKAASSSPRKGRAAAIKGKASTPAAAAAAKPSSPSSADKRGRSRSGRGVIVGIIVLLAILSGGLYYYSYHYAGEGGGPSSSSRVLPSEQDKGTAAGTTTIASKKEKLFTAQDLAEAKEHLLANPETAPIYLVIVGHVFNVSEGKEFYAPGGGYDFFTFRDGSKAFVSGDFTPEGLTDDLSGMSEDECKAVYRWLTFFEEKSKDGIYPYAGKMVGRFFDDKGQATEEFEAFRTYAGLDESSNPLPKSGPVHEYCAIRWAKDEGHTVWCEEEGKVPRKLLLDNGYRRCICVDLRDAEARTTADNVELYPECDPSSNKCSFA